MLEDARGRVALRGRIDRVDVSAKRDVANDNTARDAVCAVDYKRRVSLPAIADLGHAAIQVPLYAIVAQRALGARSAHGRYLSTLSPRPVTSQFEDRFAALVAAAPDGSTEATRAALDAIHALRERRDRSRAVRAEMVRAVRTRRRVPAPALRRDDARLGGRRE